MNPVVVRFHRLAADEFRSAYQWYANQSPATAVRFAIAIDSVIQRIISPASGAPFRGPFRWMKTKRFPYFVFYRCVIPANEVRIQALAHARRRPGYWLRRTWS